MSINIARSVGLRREISFWIDVNLICRIIGLNGDSCQELIIYSPRPGSLCYVAAAFALLKLEFNDELFRISIGEVGLRAMRAGP